MRFEYAILHIDESGLNLNVLTSSERPDKGKGVARPKKRQRQAPKYVLRVPAKLPTIVARSTSSVGPPPTPTIQPPTPAVDPNPSSAIHPYPTPAVHPSPTLAAHTSTTPTTDPLPPPVIISPTPPLVLITPTPLPDPTSIPSLSCIPPSETVTPSADPDSSGDSEAIPDDDKKPFWERFQWKPEHETQIQQNFHMKASHRLSKMFRDARNAGERPYWLGEQIWNSLMAHWNRVEFRSKCAKAQRNRASEKGGTLHTGWSITIHEHAIPQALGRAVHVDEVFAQTHVRKGTNQFVDERSRKTHEEFSTRLSQVRSEHESAPTSDDVSNAEDDIRRTQCWVDIIGGKKKGRVYGAGTLATNYTTSRGGTLKHEPSSSTTTANEAVIHLTQALEQRDQEISDLRVEFTNFKALVMRLLPETSQAEFNIPPTQPQPSSSPAVPQQPTSVPPSSVQPTSVHPTLVQPSKKFEVACSRKEIFVFLQNETDLWMETR
ncbi:hypothetical protein LR48_Vigan221s003100 [Vigna angularis]|uniref:Transposase, Ptta/En/Spm, plant n=1 Tax=Phaseolus angularis TaxID=3914 RepID=A0A0L9T7I7_PHAAN|nr:hypothetical protein LR48_Vigan221s003100 [Vigna angularis]